MIEYNYDDILLQPKFSVLNSRSEADTSCKFGPRVFKLPVVPANMKTVVDEKLCTWLAENNYFYVMHRFGIDTLKFCQHMRHRNLYISISVGVNDDSYKTLEDIKFSGITPDYITIDIAHGHCEKMKKMLTYLKKNFPKSFLIAGNVCTQDGVRALEEWGASAVKVGIGPGCFIAGTKVLTKTGFKNIENIEINEEVLTHKNRYMPVISKLSRKEEDFLIKINGQYSSTGNHEYYVLHKKYKDVVNDDNINEYAEWIKADELDTNYLLIRSNNKYELVEIEKLEKIDFNGDVYDLEVKNDHSYNVNKILVHNSVCTTKLQTGFSRPQFSAVLDCSEVAKVPIVADGGIHHIGDIAKALVAGADMIMLGSILSGHEESPGDLVTYVNEQGVTIGQGKEYFGSASEHNRNEKRHVEGKKIVVKIKGPIADTYKHITESLRSSISYAGGKDLSAFNSVEWIVVH